MLKTICSGIPSRKILMTCAFLLAAISTQLSAIQSAPRIGKLPKQEVAEWKLRTLDGSERSLAGMRGQVVVLDFFAVWCSHSREHIPSIVRLSQSAELQNAQIIGLAVQDERSTPEKVQNFIREQKITWPVAMISDPAFARYVDSRDISVPQTLVYGRDGRLAGYFNGHDARTEEALMNVIRRELEKK